MKRAVLLLFLALPLAAQTTSDPPRPKGSIDCTKDLDGKGQAELTKVDEISSNNTGVLRGTLFTVSEQIRMPTGSPGKDPTCYPQWVRAYRMSAPASWNPPSSQISIPMPGPTLRAKVGDAVNLTFFNVIDAAKFPDSDQGCDQTNVYPTPPNQKEPLDKYPDCFAHSVFTNVHFHGTHTSPNTTADNVFITVRPSPRDPNPPDPKNKNIPLILPSDVTGAFGRFFEDCNTQLIPATTSKMWPVDWKKDLKLELQNLLLGYVEKYGLEGWFKKDNDLITGGYWPQYFVGAYPYCFDLPKWAPLPKASMDSGGVGMEHSHGAGSSELLMGQAPGTHWYHAHRHGSTTVNVMNGMTGVFIIEGDYDVALRKYYGTNFVEKVLVIQQLGSVPPMVTGSGGDVNFFVNGQFKPVLKMAGNSVQMWRIANTSARAGAYFPAGKLQWKQLAIDGVQLAPDNYDSRPGSFLIASGNRIDLLVKAPAYKEGGDNKYNVLVYRTVDPTDRPPAKPTAQTLTLLTVEVTKDGQDMDFIPSSKLDPLPGFLHDVTDAEIAGSKPKTLTFATSPIDPLKPVGSTPAKHTIDGMLFDENNPPVEVTLNRAEEWKVVNESYAGTAISHPFHIHVNPFQLTEIFSPSAYVDLGSIKTRGGELPAFARASVTSGSAEVSGSFDSKFLTWFRVGDVIAIPGGQGGSITNITGDRQMTMAQKATATVSDAIFNRLIPQYTIDKEKIRQGQCYLDPNDKATWKPCTGKTVDKDKILPDQCYVSQDDNKPCIEPESKTQRVWWDVFPIPSGKVFTRTAGEDVEIPGYFRMRSRFVDFPGYFVMHCHILAHEDRGMMTEVYVNPEPPRKTPYAHH
jgi:FtsP/CotA-like multicopper oxidase with cupredoxin domain